MTNFAKWFCQYQLNKKYDKFYDYLVSAEYYLYFDFLW